jgi:hypothetical protein
VRQAGIRRLFGRQQLLERMLNRVEDARLLRRQVTCEVTQESLLQEPAPIVVEDNAGCGRMMTLRPFYSIIDLADGNIG